MSFVPQYLVEKRFNKELKRRRKVRLRKIKGLQFNYLSRRTNIIIRDKIQAPKIFNYLKNPLDCNFFYNQLRNRDLCNFNRGKAYFKICLRKIEDIDFAALSILKSIMEEAALSGIMFTGSLPVDRVTRRKLIDLGFLKNLDFDGSDDLNIQTSGNHFSYEKKSGIMTVKDYENFDHISEKAYNAITGNNGYFDELITVLKEIGTNAVEWSNSKGKQWMIGFFEKDNKVTINIIDLGFGILDSLYIEKKLQFIDFFMFRGPDKILERAFIQKYGSLSQEINRNKGLPFIKATFDEKKIKNLVVSTNNIFYNFEKTSLNKISRKLNTNFSGTFYQMEIDKSCIENYG